MRSLDFPSTMMAAFIWNNMAHVPAHQTATILMGWSVETKPTKKCAR